MSTVAAYLPSPERLPLKRIAAIAALVSFGLFWGVFVAYQGLSAALLCVALVVTVFTVRDFRVGVLVMIFIMPVSSSYIFPRSMFGVTGLNPLNLLLIGTFASYLLAAMPDGSIRRFIPLWILPVYILPIILAGLNGMGNVDLVPAFFFLSESVDFKNWIGYLRDDVMKPLIVVMYALLVGAAYSRSRAPEKFLTAAIVSMWIMALLAIMFFLNSGLKFGQLASEYARAFFSPLGMHANDLGRLYAVAFALLLFVWDRTHRLSLKALLVIAMVAVAAALFLTFSRGAFFGFVIVCMLYFILRRTVKTFLIIVTLVVPALIFAPGALWSRLETGLGAGLNEITAGRVDEIWMPLLPEIAKTPPWGSGLASVLWSRPMRMEEMFFVAHPHNAYLQVYMDLGIIGTILVLAFWMHSLRGFWKLRGDERLVPEMQGFFEGAAVGLVSFLIAGIAGSSLLPAPEQGYLWLALGMMWGVRKHLARIPAAVVEAPVPAADLRPPAFDPSRGAF